jgi:hypothetical protein
MLLLLIKRTMQDFRYREYDFFFKKINRNKCAPFTHPVYPETSGLDHALFAFGGKRGIKVF